MKNNYIAYILFLTTILLFSCASENKPTELQSFFKKFSNQIKSSKLEEYRLSIVDSTGKTLEIMDKEIDTMYLELLKNVNLKNYIDSFLLSAKLPYLTIQQKTFLNLAFHEYLNGEEIFDTVLTNKLRKILKHKWREKDKFNKLENVRIYNHNYYLINIKDTFQLVLPVENKNKRKHAFYTLGYPNSYSYVTADDSVTIKVFLIDKYYGKKPVQGTVDSTSLIFKVQIIETSDSSVHIPTFVPKEKLKSGTQFELCLDCYGRLINVE